METGAVKFGRMPSAARVSWARFRVFIVSLVALVILSTLIALLTGGRLLQPKAKLYLYVPDVTGLTQDSPVRVDGIGVGKVDSVELSGSNDPNRVVKITMTVERATLATMPADSYAELSTDSLIGDRFVDVTSGRASNSIAPGGELTFHVGGMMKSLDMRQFEQQLRNVDALLTDIEQGRSRVGQFIKGEDAYNSLKKRVAEIHNEILTATNKNTAIGQALYTDKLYRAIRDPLAKLDQSLAQLQSGQGAIGQLLTDSGQYEQVHAAVLDFSKTVADFHAGDLVQSDAAYTQWNQALAGVIRQVDNFNTDPMIASAQAYESLNGFGREMANTLRDFREDPRKYLRLKLF